MEIDFILTGIYLFAMVQGSTFCLGLLLTRVRGSGANRTLALLVSLITLYLAGEALYTSGLMSSAPYFLGVRYPLLFSFGPLLYLYSRLLVGRGAWRAPVAMLHFLPLLLALAVNLPVIGLSLEEKRAYVQMLYGVNELSAADRLRLLWASSGWAHLVLYCLAVLGLLRQHGRRIVQEFSSLERISLHWLRLLSGLCLITGLLGFLLSWGSLLQGYPLVNSVNRFIEVLLALLIYVVGYMGFWQPVVFRRREEGRSQTGQVAALASCGVDSSSELVQQTVASESVSPSVDKPGRGKYEKSSLPPSVADALKAQLLAMMEEQALFLDNALTLASLSTCLNIPSHQLSQVINTSLGVNFFEFINHYRVEYAKHRLADPQYANEAIVDIAVASGYNNKTTFYQAFKKATSLTPSQYRKQYKH